MQLREFKHQLHILGFSVSLSQHHSWLVTTEKLIKGTNVSRDCICAEVSTKYQNYVVSQPQYLSNDAVDIINGFAGTDVQQREYSIKQHYIVYTKTDNSFRYWYLVNGKCISYVITSYARPAMSKLIKNNSGLTKKYIMTSPQVSKVEKYLRKHHVHTYSVKALAE